MNSIFLRRGVWPWLVALSLLAGLVPGAATALTGDFEVTLQTLKVNTAGGNLNRYSITDAIGNGYGVSLSYTTGRLTLERRDDWAVTPLANSPTTLPGGMVLGDWYTLRLIRTRGELIAEAFLGQVDPAISTPALVATTADSRYQELNRINVNGGHEFYTDNVRVFANGRLILDESFDDGDISNVQTLLAGQIDLVPSPDGGYVLRKFGFNDPNGGTGALLTGDLEVTVETLKVNTAGGNLNRYSVTDEGGNGYGISLNASSGRLSIDRRDAWAVSALAFSADSLPGGMVLGDWYTLRLIRNRGELIAEAYLGQVDPVSSKPVLVAAAEDFSYTDFTRFNVNGGYDFDTDNIRVIANERLTLAEDFDDGDSADWQVLLAGQVILVPSPGGGFALRKTASNDPNGGFVGLLSDEIDVMLATRKVNTLGGNTNRYSITDISGNGYAVSLNLNGRLRIERRDAWALTQLAQSASTLPGGMVLDDWYRLRLQRRGNSLAAALYLGKVDPLSATPVLEAEAADARYSDLPQFSVNGGFDFDTDDVSVRASGRRALEDDFDDGDIADWRDLLLGRIGLVADGAGFVLRKYDRNDPNGGAADPSVAPTVLTFDPATDGVAGIDDYEAAYGVQITGADLLADPGFTQDGWGVVNSAPVAALYFDFPVSRIDLDWVRLYPEVDLVATAYDANGSIVHSFLSEACPLGDCSLSALSGTELITASGVVRLELEGTPPDGSTLGRTDIVGIDTLLFEP